MTGEKRRRERSRRTCNGEINDTLTRRSLLEKSLTPWWTAEFQRWKRKIHKARITAQQERDKNRRQKLTDEFKRTKME